MVETALKIEDVIKKYFLKPFSRRLGYIFTGIYNEPSTYILGNKLDTELVYYDPSQCTGMVKILNIDLNNRIKEWFGNFNISMTDLGIIYIEKLAQTMNKHKWKVESFTVQTIADGSIYLLDIVTQESFLIYAPAHSYFTMSRLELLISNYIPTLFENKARYVDISLESESKYVLQTLEEDLLNTNRLVDYECQTCKVVLFQGHDLLNVKFLKEDVPYETGVRVWNDGPGSLNYGAYFRNSDVNIILVRDNILIFPKQKGRV